MAYTTSKAFGRYVKQDIAKQSHWILSFTQYHKRTCKFKELIGNDFISTAMKSIKSALCKFKLESTI